MRIGAFVAAAAAGATMIVSAAAEPIVPSQDKSIPISIDAKRADVRDKENIAIFSDAKVSQGDRRLQCKSLTVRYDAAKTIQQFECEP